MNQRCEPDSKTNTETLEQTKSTSQPRRARPKTERQAPTNLNKSFKSEASATEEESTTATKPATNQAVCRIKQAIFTPFMTNDYLAEIIRKIILPNNFP